MPTIPKIFRPVSQHTILFYLAYLFFSAQAAIDRIVASSAKPSSSHAPQPAQPVQVEQQEVAQDQESQAATENMLATQNDMLNTVTQLLQQTDSVNRVSSIGLNLTNIFSVKL